MPLFLVSRTHTNKAGQTDTHRMAYAWAPDALAAMQAALKDERLEFPKRRTWNEAPGNTRDNACLVSGRCHWLLQAWEVREGDRILPLPTAGVEY